MTDWTVIGVKKDTHKRFKQQAQGQHHDHFVNVLLDLWDLAPDNLKAQAILGQQGTERRE